MQRSTITLIAVAALAVAAPATPTFAGFIIQLDIAGTNSTDLLGDPDNTIFVLDVDPGLMITGIGYDATLSTNGDSWISEANILVGNGSGSSLLLTPGAGWNIPGQNVALSSGGLLSTFDLGGPIFLTGNQIRIEFAESFDDFANGVDAVWTSGTLFLEVTAVPAPGALAALSLPALLGRRRRRLRD